MGFPRICRCPRRAGRPSRRLLLPRSFWAVRAPHPHASPVPSPPRRRRSPRAAPSSRRWPKHLGGSRGPGAAPRPRPRRCSHSHLSPSPTPAQTSPAAERPGAPAASTPQGAWPPRPEPRRPQGGSKSVSAATRVPRSGTPPPCPSLTSLPGWAEVSESGRGASPGNFTNLPGVAGQRRCGRGLPGNRAVATRDHRRGPAGSVALLRAAAGWVVRLYPVPILARWRSPEHTHLHSARPAAAPPAPLLCSLPLPSSCWPETHFASARHPRPAANSPPERTLRSGRRRPRHLRLGARGRRVRLPLAPRRLPAALARGGGDRGAQRPRLFEVPLVRKKKISNTAHASDLL